MLSLRQFSSIVCSVVLSLPAFAKDSEAERGYQGAVKLYAEDEARLPTLIHYQQVTGAGSGESVRREAWVSLDDQLVKTVEERRGPKGSELLETSLSESYPYFTFHQTTALQPDGGMRVDEERKYRSNGTIVRWSKRSASFAAGVPVDMKAVKQQQLPIDNLKPDDVRTDWPTEAAEKILETLKAAGKPDHDPAANAGPDWKRIKLVKNTQSPNGRYQLAWAPKKFDGNWQTYYDTDLKDYVFFDGEVTNYVFDLEKMRIVGETLGTHFGSRQRYNHREVEMAWSPDSGTFIELTTGKWQYETCCAGRVVDGKLAGCVELGKPVEKQAAAFLVAKKDGAWRKHHGSMAINLGSPEVSNDGTLGLTLYAEIPKALEPETSATVRVRLRLGTGPKGVSLTPVGAAYSKE